MKESDIKRAIREGYGTIARQSASCCGPTNSCCCSGTTPAADSGRYSAYTEDETGSVPEGANLGLGCGNPVALASLNRGDTVLDLGSGAGFDCFLAANKVGETGLVIGVDMTPEMIERARTNVLKSKYENVEFRLGEIENLPVANNSVDVIISNCVINLASDKKRVFVEAFRVLKPGGRLMVSDIVLSEKLPENIRNSIAAYVSCIAGAILKDDYIAAIRSAGFVNITILNEVKMESDAAANNLIFKEHNFKQEEIKDTIESISSISISATKSI